MTPSAAVTMCRTFLDEWSSLGVEHAVVAPGSRSTPMTLALVGDGRFQVHVFHDERSAAFAALGIGLATLRPAVLLCTSGTAAAEFFPAVAEASQACVPMIVCTADRPPELQGVGAPQTMNQQRLYGDYVRAFLNIAPPTLEERDAWRSWAREAFDSTIAGPPGPAHVNLQFREPLVGEVGEIPRRNPPVQDVQRDIGESGSVDLAVITDLGNRGAGMLLVGAGVDDPEGVVRLGERLGWPVLADPRSGCRSVDGRVIVHADAILRHGPTADRLVPRVILRVGEPPASKVVNQWVARSGALVVSVTATGRNIDPEGIVSKHLLCRVADIERALAGASKHAEYADAWWEAESIARRTLAQFIESDPSVTEPWVARTVGAAVNTDGLLLLSSSMPVRDVEWFAERCPPRVYSNRGVNGIDGVMSTGLGLALGTGRPVTVLIGDVAFLHDSNALINLSQRGVALRIVVVDNRGGGIFSFLDQAKVLEHAPFERFYGTPHDSDLVALASAHGVPAQLVEDKDGFRSCLDTMDFGVIVVRTRRDENVVFHQQLNDAVATVLAERVNSL